MSVKHSHKIHKYELINGTWACGIRGCTHFLPANVPKGALHRTSLCWNCGEEFLIDEIAFLQNKPVCPDCDKENPIRILKEIQENQESQAANIVS